MESYVLDDVPSKPKGYPFVNVGFLRKDELMWNRSSVRNDTRTRTKIPEVHVICGHGVCTFAVPWPLPPVSQSLCLHAVSRVALVWAPKNPLKSHIPRYLAPCAPSTTAMQNTISILLKVSFTMLLLMVLRVPDGSIGGYTSAFQTVNKLCC